VCHSCSPLGETETRLLKKPRSNDVLRRRKIAALDEPDEFVPFGMGQPDRVLIFSDCDGLGSNHDFRAFGAMRAKGEFDRVHLAHSLIQPADTLESVVATEASAILKPHPEIAIGELSRRTQCNIETIRYYERIGLLPRARREGRFRRYDGDDVARLRFIRRARELGFTLDQVRGLLRLAAADGELARAAVRSIAAAHVADIRSKITDLRVMERVLADAICECEATQQPKCPLIEVLSANRFD
jgi:MerR family mercuric resistance operon transcriptional regulator